MKKQKGFTLIELLLVLAIIGTITLIAIPALLGQRSRSRDRTAQSNATSILTEFVAAIDKAREEGIECDTVDDINNNIVEKDIRTTRVPPVWSYKNPWPNKDFPEAYNKIVWPETDLLGADTRRRLADAPLGRVELGFMSPNTTGEAEGATRPTRSIFVAGVLLYGNIKDEKGGDTKQLVKIVNID